MTHYRATFTDGMILHRNSVKKLTHAWRWKGADADGAERAQVGFASSRTLADQAARIESNFLVKRPTRGKWGAAHRDSWRPGRLDSIEIVAVEIVK